MSIKPKILAFAGSTRKDSFNKKLVKIAADGAIDAGADVTFIDFKEFPLPVFDQDLEAEEGMPANAKKIKAMFIESDGFLIAAPEYNSSITPLLKNVIDWVSRATKENEAPLKAYNGKCAAIMSASPGGLGGLRGLVHLRAILENINVMVLPQQRAIGSAFKAFDDEGQLVDEKQQDSIKQLGKDLTQLISKIKS